MVRTDVADQYRKILAHNVPLKIEAFLKSTGPLELRDLLAVVRLDQDHRWKAGTGPSAESYFERFPQLKADADVAMELIEAEFHLRRAGKEIPPIPAFVARFPQWAERLYERLRLSLRPGSTDAEAYAPTVANTAPKPSEPVDRPASAIAIPGYEILGELAHGSMGVVYKARQSWLNRMVAIKMVRGSDKAESVELIRFLAEAESIAAIKHPSVLSVYEFGESQGCPYMVMEFVDGGTLSRRLREKGLLEPTEAAVLLERLARGAHAAHDCGIVHRDLKPSNVLLSSELKMASGKLVEPRGHAANSDGLYPKISDFGLAKRGDGQNLTGSKAILGTPSYMAPEQARGETKFVGPSADIYALGVILYECLTGSVPFRNRDMWAVVESVIRDAPDPPRKRNPKIPRDLDLICLRCLAKKPHERYLTAAALADDLARFQKGEPVSVRPAGRVQKTMKWIRRHPAMTALLVASAFAVPASIGFAMWAKIQVNHTRQELAVQEQRERETEGRTRRLIRYLKEHPADLKLEPDQLEARFLDANPDMK
jgi:serine/threonine protein kinase